ncbi:MAG: ribosome silencing factor [Chitinophagaceae bacterium]
MTIVEAPNLVRGKKITRNSKIFKAIIHAIREKKGDQLISLDLRKIPEAVSDFFIICTAGSNIQARAIAGYIEEYVNNLTAENPYKQEGQQSGQWVLIDYVNIVVHVMMEEQRKFYQLEEMWSDAPQMEHIEE